MKHSPSPWRQGSEYSNSQDEIEDDDGRSIAVVWTRSAPERATARPQFKDVPMLKQNLAMMLRAPEMYEALMDLLDVFGDCEGTQEKSAIQKARDIFAALDPDSQYAK